MAKKNKHKKGEFLMSVLSNGSTDKALKLLKDKTGETAQNEKDLEYKLSKMYINSTDKVEIEKQLATIHPHKDFILKYLAPKIETPTESPKVEEVKHIQEVKKMASAEGDLISNPMPISDSNKNITTIAVFTLGTIAMVGLIMTFAMILINNNIEI